GDPLVPALRRQPGVHPRRRAAVQWQRRELQRLVPRTAVAAALSLAGQPAPGTDAAAGGGQYPACAPAAGGPDADTAPPRLTLAEAAHEFRGADGAAAVGQRTRDLHSAGQLGRDGHGAESIVSGGQEA